MLDDLDNSNRFRKRIKSFMNRVFDIYISQQTNSFQELNTNKLNVQMFNLEVDDIDNLEYAQNYLSLFYTSSHKNLYKFDKFELSQKIWDNFDSALTTFENFLLKIGFLQNNHHSEVSYLTKEIGSFTPLFK